MIQIKTKSSLDVSKIPILREFLRALAPDRVTGKEINGGWRFKARWVTGPEIKRHGNEIDAHAFSEDREMLGNSRKFTVVFSYRTEGGLSVTVDDAGDYWLFPKYVLDAIEAGRRVRAEIARKAGEHAMLLRERADMHDKFAARLAQTAEQEDQSKAGHARSCPAHPRWPGPAHGCLCTRTKPAQICAIHGK